MKAVRVQLAGAATALLLVACTSGKSDPSATSPANGSAVSTSSAPSSSTSGNSPAASVDWPTYHGDLERTGFSASMPAASGALKAKRVRLDESVYASPIVVHPSGSASSFGVVIVTTENNSVYGLSVDGVQLWKVNLGAPTPRSALPCGNIDPLGLTGTPIYDAASDSVFVVASLGTTARHDLVALDPASGVLRWRRSVDLAGTDPRAMQQRGALSVLGGRVWVPFGGLFGDCGAYKGRVVGVPVRNGEPIEYTVPTTREAGIWAPPGPTVFGNRMFVAVGNGESLGEPYDFSDSVLELDGTKLVDSFSPDTWAADNRADLDLGSQGPTVVQRKWIFIAGKSETGYVLRIGRLGGIGGEVSQARVCASYGGTAVVGDTVYVPCSDGLRAIRISASGVISELWHAQSSISGSPVVGGGRVYSLDQKAGVLYALDPATSLTRERVIVGETTRFATPAISGSKLIVPTLSGVTVVQTAQ
jgi:outer membrane protein assembly factor BamB